MKSRIDWIDMAKGYGIIFVILGHLNVGLLGKWLYTFHIPLFFFLSGYVFHIEPDFKLFLRKKAKAILLPYFVLGIPMIPFAVMEWFKQGWSTKEMLVGYFVKELLIQRRLWTLWFIACLFWLNILFYWIVKLIRSEKAITVIVLAMICIGVLYYQLGGQALPWNIDVCFTAIAFFGAGYFYKKNVIVVDAFLSNRWKPLVWISGFWAINIVFGISTYIISGNGLEMFYNQYGFAPFTYISAFAGIFGTVLVAKRVTFRPIRYIGRNSLIYFAWHQTIMIPIVVNVLGKMGIWDAAQSGWGYQVIYLILETALILLLLTMCSFIVEHTGLRVLLGKGRCVK